MEELLQYVDAQLTFLAAAHAGSNAPPTVAAVAAEISKAPWPAVGRDVVEAAAKNLHSAVTRFTLAYQAGVPPADEDTALCAMLRQNVDTLLAATQVVALHCGASPRLRSLLVEALGDILLLLQALVGAIRRNGSSSGTAKPPAVAPTTTTTTTTTTTKTKTTKSTDETRTGPQLTALLWQRCDEFGAIALSNREALGRDLVQAVASIRDATSEVSAEITRAEAALKEGGNGQGNGDNDDDDDDDDDANDDDDDLDDDFADTFTLNTATEIAVASAALVVVKATQGLVNGISQALAAVVEDPRADRPEFAPLLQLAGVGDALGDQVDELCTCLYSPQQPHQIRTSAGALAAAVSSALALVADCPALTERHRTALPRIVAQLLEQGQQQLAKALEASSRQ